MTQSGPTPGRFDRRDREGDFRKSHAPLQQTASGAVTWVSSRGAGVVRLLSDRLRLGKETITKAEYDRQTKDF